jgi:hypothetical protein
MVKHLLRGLTAEVRVEILVKIHELTGAHPGGDGGALRQIADHGVGLPAGGPAVDQNFPAAGGQQAIGQLDEGGLAAAVGTQKAHDPARLNGKADAIQRRNFAVALGELVTF